LHRAIPALRRAGRPAGLRSPRRADRIQRVGLARPVPVLPIGPVYLDDPDAGRGQVPGQARAVTAGALDADQGHLPEPAQPARTPPGRPRGREPRAGEGGNPRTPRRPPMESSAAATCMSAWVSTPPVMAHASSTMVIAVPFCG